MVITNCTTPIATLAIKRNTNRQQILIMWLEITVTIAQLVTTQLHGAMERSNIDYYTHNKTTTDNDQSEVSGYSYVY